MGSGTKIPIIIISILVVVFAAAAWFGSRMLNPDSIDPLQAFPRKTALVLEIPDAASFFTELETNNAFWNDLLENPQFSVFNTFVEQAIALSKNDEKLHAFFRQNWYLGLTDTDISSLSDFLLIVKNNNTDVNYLQEKLFNQLQNADLKKNDSSYFELNINKSSFFVCQAKGLLFVSNKKQALTLVKTELNKAKPFVESTDFIRLQKTKGMRADAYIYIHYAQLNNIAEKLLDPSAKETLLPSAFANMSILDVLLKKEEILINGYTTAYDSLGQFLAAFRNQKGKQSQLAEALPYSTESFIAFNLSDYPAFIEKQKLAYQSKTKKSTPQMRSNWQQQTESWWAGEMALVFDSKQKEYAVCTAKSGRETFRVLADIAHQSQPEIIMETYREQKIKQINNPDFLVSQFGTLFSPFKEVYFCVIDEAVIFAKSMADIKSYIDAIILGNNLSKNEGYIEFSDNLSDEAVVRIYSNSFSPASPLARRLSNKADVFFKNYSTFSSHIQGIGIQISNKNDLFYTGLFISYGSKQVHKTSAWQSELEAPIEAGPFLVKNHETKGLNILAQDAFNTLYLLNAKGDIVWSQPLKERILSQVFSVDYFKNNKWQYLFNTANFLYLIDINGNPVADYPIQLNSEATNGIQVLDYDQKKDYRIILAGKNGELYNYELNGRLLKGWQAENTRKEITKPLTHLIANKKDYLIFEASNGDIIMTDRRGNKRLEIRKSFTNALGSDIYVNRTNSSKGILLTTDTKGELVYIPETGPVSSTSFGKMSPEHYFLYSDFDGNSVMDFIYLDQTKLRIFDNFKNTILTYDFAIPITQKPQLFELNGREILGIVDTENKQLYLFDKNGLIADQLRKGETTFVTGRLEKNARLSLLIGMGKSVYSYPLD